MNQWAGADPASRRAHVATAVETDFTASAWPTTRLPIASSIFRSFSFSPSSMRSTGMPVQRDTTAAMLSAVTASDATTRLSPVSFSLTAFSLASSSGTLPYCSSPAFW